MFTGIVSSQFLVPPAASADDFTNWLNQQMDQAYKIYNGAYDQSLPNLRPHAGVHNPGGQLIRILRGTEIVQYRKNARAVINGSPTLRVYTTPDPFTRAEIVGSAFEFYADGTFLLVKTQRQVDIDLWNWQVYRGSYSASPQGITFNGVCHTTVNGQQGGSANIRGNIVTGPDGQPQAHLEESSAYGAHFNSPWGFHNSTTGSLTNYVISLASGA